MAEIFVLLSWLIHSVKTHCLHTTTSMLEYRQCHPQEYILFRRPPTVSSDVHTRLHKGSVEPVSFDWMSMSGHTTFELSANSFGLLTILTSRNFFITEAYLFFRQKSTDLWEIKSNRYTNVVTFGTLFPMIRYLFPQKQELKNKTTKSSQHGNWADCTVTLYFTIYDIQHSKNMLKYEHTLYRERLPAKN